MSGSSVGESRRLYESSSRLRARDGIHVGHRRDRSDTAAGRDLRESDRRERGGDARRHRDAEKVRNARNASDTRPIETTWRQGGVTDTSLGSRFWKTGMPKTYKWGDRHVFSDRFMIEAQYAHIGNNFVLDFHEPGLANVQPLYDQNTLMWACRHCCGCVHVARDQAGHRGRLQRPERVPVPGRRERASRAARRCGVGHRPARQGR